LISRGRFLTHQKPYPRYSAISGLKRPIVRPIKRTE